MTPCYSNCPWSARINCLAITYLQSDRTQEAEALLNEALGISQALKELILVSFCHYYLARLAQQRGARALALEHRLHAVTYMRSLHLPELEARLVLVLLPQLVGRGHWRDSYQALVSLGSAVRKLLRFPLSFRPVLLRKWPPPY